MVGRSPGAPATRHGFGSGFIVDSSGLIVTNRHVVENAVRITVTLQDETTLPAHVVGRLSLADVALLEVPLPTLRWGDSDRLRLGDDVVAIGNPLGLGGSISSGIVSGLNRDIRTTPYDDFIQTDAAINHGNSGGPLFDMHGLVVGINTAIFSPTETGGSIGISFALPSQVAEFIVDQTRRYGRVRSGTIGVRLQTVTPDIADALGFGDGRGALILAIDRGSSAAAAGLRRGDVITQVGDQTPPDARALLRAIAIAPLDQPLTLKVRRQGETLTVAPVVRVLEPPNASGETEAATARRVAMTPFDPGLTLAGITDPLRAKYKLPADSSGVLVIGVSQYSPADTRGIVPGDVIVQADQQGVKTPAEVNARIAAVRRRQGEYILLLVSGHGGDRYVALPVHPRSGAPDIGSAQAQGGQER